MAENLLSISNINLFGQVISELDIVDPDKARPVRVSTTENVAPLSGLGPIDGIALEPRNLVLVGKQNDSRENGIYRVGAGAGNPWAPEAEENDKLKVGSIVRPNLGATQAKSNFQLVDIERINVPASTTVTLSAVVDATSSVDSINVSGTSILSTPVFQSTGESAAKLAAKVAAAINEDELADYTATSAAAVITIRAPKQDGDKANGRVVTVNVTSLTATVGGAMAGAAVSYRRTLRNLGDKRAGTRKRRGENKQLERQLMAGDARFARIYGFSYEGTYYDLPRPTLFLVHGDGELATVDALDDQGAPSPSRAPGATSLTGLAAAGFDFADGLRVWSYDQADYTIRMDIETGMFEQVLLDAMFDGGGPGGIEASGMNARGMNARGMNARGMNARGMNARGMNARGMNARGNSD